MLLIGLKLAADHCQWLLLLAGSLSGFLEIILIAACAYRTFLLILIKDAVQDLFLELAIYVILDLDGGDFSVRWFFMVEVRLTPNPRPKAYS